MRKRFERFCYMNRSKGIPSLMLYIVIASGIVSLTSMVGYSQIYNMLMFDRAQILKGQVWRLLTWIITDGSGSASGIFMDLIMLYCYFSLGKAMENAWGTLKFNLFYITGIVLMDIFAMALGGLPIEQGYEFININGTLYPNEGWLLYSSSMSYFLHLSMLVGFATLYRDAQFVIFFVLPIKASILALLYLILVGVQVISMSVPEMYFPHNLAPLVGMLNYFLFFGKEVLYLLPGYNPKPKKQGPYAPQKPINIKNHTPKAKPTYRHRCTICGRTDVSNPELEFRYCSRCNGYFCYCEDHINNHEHVE